MATRFDSLDNRLRAFFGDILELDTDALMVAISKLPPREKEAIELRYGLRDGIWRTYNQVGTILGVQQERVRQIIVKGMYRLRHWRRLGQYCLASYKRYYPQDRKEMKEMEYKILKMNREAYAERMAEIKKEDEDYD